MRIVVAVVIFVICCFPAFASDEKHILFLDGARIERDVSARKGLIEVSLPAAMLPQSFRVKPLGTTTVLRVEIGPVSADGKLAGQLAALEEQRAVLLDRVKSLDEREGIFKAAAKSQSGRALRKNKSNPDPLGAIRSGTRYALSQLDEISAARRQIRKALAGVDAQITTLEKELTPRNVARVWLSQPSGRARVAYLVSNLNWTPKYDFRLTGDGYVEIALWAKVVPVAGNISMSVVPLLLGESRGTIVEPYPVSSEISTIATFRAPLAKEELTSGAVPSLSVLFSNSSLVNLPSGEANGYWQGEYFGTSSFCGCLAGKSMSLVFGKNN